MAEYENQASVYIRSREPVPYEELLPHHDEVELYDEEVEHFKRDGFLVKRGLVKADAEFERIIDYVWETVPEGVMVRDDPTTWIDRPHRRGPADVAAQRGVLQRSNWKMRSPYKHGRESFILDVTANHPNVRNTVRQFVGRSRTPSLRVRGIYLVLPKPVEVEQHLGPHVDHSAAQLSAMVYVGETPRRHGGFTIWPGSHEQLHRFWISRQGAHFEPSVKTEFNAVYRGILQKTVPVEFVGQPGDVVFWHPRLIHSAGVNYSAATAEPRIRYAIPCDFQKDGYTFYDDDDLGPGARRQWWVDTRHFREDLPPTPDNIWGDWAI